MTRVDFLALLARLVLGYLFFSSGLCKLTGGEFGQLMGPPEFIKMLTPYGLAGFAIFVAGSQVIIGALIFSQRFSLLGLVALVPINVSMIAVTTSQGWRGTPFVDAFFLLINLLLLLYEWPTLKVFINPDAPRTTDAPRTNRLFPNRGLPVGVILTALLASVLARYNGSLTVLFALLCLGFMYLNIWLNCSLLTLDRATLFLSLVAMLSVTLAKPLQTVQINAVVVFEFATLIGFGLVVLSFWQQRRISQPSGG